MSVLLHCNAGVPENLLAARKSYRVLVSVLARKNEKRTNKLDILCSKLDEYDTPWMDLELTETRKVKVVKYRYI